MNEKNLNFVQHHDDEYIDEVVLFVNNEPFIRCVVIPRYKTSSLGSNGWRIHAEWQHIKEGFWTPFDSGYCNIDMACRALYPCVFSCPDWHRLDCTSIRLFRKNHCVLDIPQDDWLIDTCGHLPWIMATWPEQPEVPGYFGGDVTKKLCFQVGCASTAVSTYTLKKRYRRDGSEFAAERHGQIDARRFCESHLRRGDRGLDDADSNYKVVSGPRPDKHKDDPI